MKLTSTAFQEPDQQELLSAAIHEASHAVLVRKFGGLASPEIWRNPRCRHDEKAWLGTCRVLAAPGDMEVPSDLRMIQGSLKDVPKLWPLYVGLAGFVGEEMARCDVVEPWQIEESLRYALGKGWISKTDRDLIDRSKAPVTEEQIATTMRYLEEYWADIEEEANRLKNSFHLLGEVGLSDAWKETAKTRPAPDALKVESGSFKSS